MCGVENTLQYLHTIYTSLHPLSRLRSGLPENLGSPWGAVWNGGTICPTGRVSNSGLPSDKGVPVSYNLTIAYNLTIGGKSREGLSAGRSWLYKYLYVLWLLGYSLE